MPRYMNHILIYPETCVSLFHGESFSSVINESTRRFFKTKSFFELLNSAPFSIDTLYIERVG